MKQLFYFILLFVFLHASARIITLSPAINEIVYALGAGEQVVGNTTYARYPEASKNVAKVGGYFSPNLEKILSLKPTLVIMQPNNHTLARQLKRLHIRTEVVPIDRLQHITQAITKLGEVLHKEQKAEEIVAGITQALHNLKGIVKGKKILMVFGHNTQITGNIFVAGQNLYFDDIINISGNTNALHSSRKGQPLLNRENIIALNPDVVILLAHAMKERKLTEKDLIDPWLELPINAAKQKHIYIIDKEYSGIPSNRLIFFLNDFRAILHGVADK